ncbi:SRPBCC family protein [Methanomethylovorans sp. PtaU1.Bin093]|uniref:SRPBCC family protein n=1 Tax=Methanomethylovorans sp. PtaU1.Bin093 TaxID=1811679 RepID=UPI0025E7628E|nr:SRPBCC family protein [Methanomethylovorans sp. PtaU1.Bin093]
MEIKASPEVIWKIMTDINNWPNWNPEVNKASLNGEVKEGETFQWKAGPGMIKSTIRSVENERLIAWTGKTLGIIDAIHVWKLKPLNGKTLVWTEESWEGIATRIFRGTMRTMLEKAIHSGLLSLKAEAESRSKQISNLNQK